MQKDNPQRLIDCQAAALLLGIKVSRLRTAIFRKEIPFIKIGRLVRFDPIALAEWLNSNSFKAKESQLERFN